MDFFFLMKQSFIHPRPVVFARFSTNYNFVNCYPIFCFTNIDESLYNAHQSTYHFGENFVYLLDISVDLCFNTKKKKMNEV